MDDIDAFLESVRGKNVSLADKYSMVGLRWIDEDNAARLLKDTEGEELAARKAELIRNDPNLKDNAAERMVRASDDWRARKVSTIEAQTKAQKLKIAMKVIDMRHSEQQSLEATKRAEMKL